MTALAKVQNFLNEFHIKVETFGIIFLNRDKNQQALLDLQITMGQRLEYITRLRPENYFSGPNTDTNDSNGPDYWEFGMNINGHEVYIKITSGKPNRKVVCMSFHIAERAIVYPFRTS